MESPGTVRDSINRAEKKGLVDNADQFGQIRETRSIIAHEYLLEDMTELYKQVLFGTPILFEVTERVKKYCQQYN